MRQGTIYILMCVFLLFIVENKNHINLPSDFSNQTLNSLTSKLTKKHDRSLSLEKYRTQYENSSVDVLEELPLDDFQQINNLIATLAVSIFSLGYILNLLYLKRKRHFFIDIINSSQSVRLFIFLRSIRR